MYIRWQAKVANQNRNQKTKNTIQYYTNHRPPSLPLFLALSLYIYEKLGWLDHQNYVRLLAPFQSGWRRKNRMDEKMIYR